VAAVVDPVAMIDPTAMVDRAAVVGPTAVMEPAATMTVNGGDGFMPTRTTIGQDG
jgi:hypothetical protein